MVEKQKTDEKMAELRKARAREDADFAAVEAAAAAEEWKQVYTLRIEREEADRRAAEAAEKLRQVEEEAARRCVRTDGHVCDFANIVNVLANVSDALLRQNCCTASCGEKARRGSSRRCFKASQGCRREASEVKRYARSSR